MSYSIAVIPGDGIGEEIVQCAQQVLEKVVANQRKNLEVTRCLAGGAAIDAEGTPLPDCTIETVKKSQAVLLGAVGGPKWDSVPPHMRAEKAILGLRQALGLYINLRPVRVTKALAVHSPLKEEVVTGADILIVRELNGGIYYGTKKEAYPVEGGEAAFDTECYSNLEVERIAGFAFRAAKLRRHTVTSVDKANVLASSRLWRKTVQQMAEQEPLLKVNHLYVDNCAMQLVLAPKQFDVILTNNIFGDILSDEAAVLAGSIGLIPSASLGEGAGLYEPIHGSAPDLAGKGVANPIGTILSCAMMMRYSFNDDAAASMIEQAVDRVLEKGYRTADLAQPGFTKVTTEEMGRYICSEIGTY